jgi:hypothetical protein
MAHVSSGHQAYIVNMLEHGGMRVVETGRLNTCIRVQEEIKEMIIPH